MAISKHSDQHISRLPISNPFHFSASDRENGHAESQITSLWQRHYDSPGIQFQPSSGGTLIEELLVFFVLHSRFLLLSKNPINNSLIGEIPNNVLVSCGGRTTWCHGHMSITTTSVTSGTLHSLGGSIIQRDSNGSIILYNRVVLAINNHKLQMKQKLECPDQDGNFLDNHDFSPGFSLVLYICLYLSTVVLAEPPPSWSMMNLRTRIQYTYLHIHMRIMT